MFLQSALGERLSESVGFSASRVHKINIPLSITPVLQYYEQEVDMKHC